MQGSTAQALGAEQLAELRVNLLAGAATLGVPLDDRAADHLLQYLELLRRWNSVYNLTAIHQPREVLVHHLLDSLAVVAPLLPVVLMSMLPPALKAPSFSARSEVMKIPPALPVAPEVVATTLPEVTYTLLCGLVTPMPMLPVPST